MAKIYYRLIKEGRWTLEKVPARWKEAVEELLNQETKSEVDI